MNRELPHHQWSHRHQAAARSGTVVIHDAPSEKQLLAIARLCDEAADHAWQCGEQLDRTAAPSIAARRTGMHGCGRCPARARLDVPPTVRVRSRRRPPADGGGRIDGGERVLGRVRHAR